MGVTAIAIVMSPWGKQSGAHFNPGITVAFFWLGKVELWDAFWYATGQFLGGISGVAIATAVLRGAPGDGTVRYAVTVPGVYGDGRLLLELIISFILMSAILFTSNRESLSPYTPYFSGALIAVYLTLEAPLSGASTNPARSLGPALHAAIGPHFGSISLRHLWACWRPQKCSCELAEESRRVAPSCTTPATSVAYSTALSNRPGAKSL